MNPFSTLFSTTQRGAAGVRDAHPLIEHVATTKMVRKGWGEERWLVPEGSPFGFKLIYIRAGRRTSLQYHERKEEANLVLSGEGVLHASTIRGEPINTCEVVAGQVVRIQPGVTHRIEAVTDLVLVEVSTPELDDVIRIEDDWQRGNGRINAEHNGP